MPSHPHDRPSRSPARTGGAASRPGTADAPLAADEGEPVVRDDWLGVEIRHLAAMIAVAKEGSFRAAAERLGYVQSSISQQVAHLERLVGQRLIERSRGGGGTALTEAGERLFVHGEFILDRFRAAHADLATLSEGASSRVRIGMCQSVATKLAPRILPVFARAFPHATVSANDAASEADVFGMVRDGRVDLGFVDLPLEPGPFDSRPLLRDPYVLVAPSGSALGRLGRSPTWREIASVPLVGHRRARFLSCVEAQIRAQGVEPNFAYRTDIDAAVQSMVAFGTGAAVMTRLIADPANSRTVLIDLSELMSPRTIAVIWHVDRTLTPEVVGFRDAALQVAERLRGRAPASGEEERGSSASPSGHAAPSAASG